MPPRKSVGSNPPEDGADGTPAKAAKEKDGMSVEDLSLPKSMIARLAKGVLPPNTQIHKDALLALHKSATVFVSYIASNSNENAQSGGKKTIAPQDVMAAMKDCEYEEFIPRLEAELKKYNETQCDKRNTYRRKVKEEKAATTVVEPDEAPNDAEAAPGANGSMNGHFIDEDEDRPAKKLKAVDGSAMSLDPDGMEDDQATHGPDDQLEEEDDRPEEDDESEGDDEDDVDDEEDEDESEPVVLFDPENLGGRGDIRDEALDDPDSDSD